MHMLESPSPQSHQEQGLSLGNEDQSLHQLRNLVFNLLEVCIDDIVFLFLAVIS